MGGLLTRRCDDGSGASYRSVLRRYDGRCDWLDDDRFLRDLERDSVDTDLLDDELRSLQAREKTSWRAKIQKCIESNPLQIAMCILVLIDAGIVVGEILLDLHAMKSKSKEAASDLSLAIGFFKNNYDSDLNGYSGDNIVYILNILQNNDSSQLLEQQPQYSQDVPEEQFLYRRRRDSPLRVKSSVRSTRKPTLSHLIHSSRNSEKHKPSSLILESVLYSTLRPVDSKSHTLDARGDQLQGESLSSYNSEKVKHYHPNSKNINFFMGREERRVRRGARSGNRIDQDPLNDGIYYKRYSDAERLLEIAHVLHYVSIAILGIFVILVFLKIIALGKHFFRKKMEMFDAFIIIASFVMDLVFVEGVTGTQNEETLIIIMIFLLWRILRIVNGIMVTSKQRQEFRIKLQRRARRRLEKRMDGLYDDMENREREILNLKSLCTNKGASEDEIAICRPRRKIVVQKLNASCGLSSIASLSLGLSLSGQLVKNHAQALPFVVPARSRRTSLAGTRSTRSSMASLAHLDSNFLASVREHHNDDEESSHSISSSNNQLDGSVQNSPRNSRVIVNQTNPSPLPAAS